MEGRVQTDVHVVVDDEEQEECLQRGSRRGVERKMRRKFDDERREAGKCTKHASLCYSTPYVASSGAAEGNVSD